MGVLEWFIIICWKNFFFGLSLKYEFAASVDTVLFLNVVHGFFVAVCQHVWI